MPPGLCFMMIAIFSWFRITTCFPSHDLMTCFNLLYIDHVCPWVICMQTIDVRHNNFYSLWHDIVWIRFVICHLNRRADHPSYYNYLTTLTTLLPTPQTINDALGYYPTTITITSWVSRGKGLLASLRMHASTFENKQICRIQQRLKTMRLSNTYMTCINIWKLSNLSTTYLTIYN